MKNPQETEKMTTKKKQNTDSDTSKYTDKVQCILISGNVENVDYMIAEALHCYGRTPTFS